MRYVASRYEEYQREEAYRICVSDTLRLMGENVARIAQGKYYNYRYFDFAHKPQKEEQTAEEVISRIKQGLDRLGGE